jgi:hypothetical protein
VPPWLPSLRGGPQRQYAAFTRAARLLTGEYAKHMPEGGTAQWLVVKYEDLPENQALLGSDLNITTSGPKLFCLLEEFEKKPAIYRKGVNATAAHRGSRFIIRGITYQAKNVEPHHRGGVWISLNKDDCCDAPDPVFFEELEALTCYREPDCGV